MSKERLEEVKDTYQSVESLIELGDFKQADIAMCYLVENFGKWLIEQAERAQELEEELNKQLETGYKIECHLYESNKQNKRYREALEKISAPIYKVTYADMVAVKRIARQALEGEK